MAARPGRRRRDALSEGGVRLEVDGPVARLTLCRPERRNAQTPATWLAMSRIAEELPDDVRIVVVAGEGPSFSAGLDRRMFTPEGVPGEGSLSDVTEGDDDAAAEVIASYQAGFRWLRESSVISIAAVQGHAVGAGFQLALSCDIRIAADDASFRMAEPALGLVPDMCGTQPLVQAVGYARALEICATARNVGAGEAERIGLVNLVVPADELSGAVDDLVASLLSTDGTASARTKQLLRCADQRSYDEQLRAERTEQVRRLKAVAGGG